MAGIGFARLFGGGSEIFGRKPKIPEGVDYTKSLSDAIATNKQILPDLEAFAKLSTEAMANVLETALPGYKSMRDAGAGIIGSKLRGELTAAETNQADQDAAEFGISSGSYGSDFFKTRNILGRTLSRHQIIQEGLDSFTQWTNQAQNTSLDFSKFFLGKEDAMRRTEFNWNRDLLYETNRAAPDPAKRGEYDAEMGVFGMMTSAYAGGAGYTQGYAQNNRGIQGNQYMAGDRNGYFGGGSDVMYDGGGARYNSSPGGAGYSSEFYSAGPQ